MIPDAPAARPGAAGLVPQVAVGAVCVRDGRLLLVRRGRGVGVGSWSLPGGRLEHSEVLADAVLRELAEETGLGGRVGPLCGIAERVFGDVHYVILDFWVDCDDGAAVAGDDADEVAWASRADLDRLDLVPRLVEFLTEHGVTGRLA